MSETVKSVFYVQFVPVHKESWNSGTVLQDEITELKAVSMTQGIPKEPKGIVVKFEYEADQETLMPVVRVRAEADTTGAVQRLIATHQQLSK